MSIRIDEQKCTGCGRCAAVCPGSLIEVQNGKAVMECPEDCWGCVSCLKECRFKAIQFFLGEDMGGGDVYMQVEENGEILDWKFYDSSGPVTHIEVDRRNSNRY